VSLERGLTKLAKVAKLAKLMKLMKLSRAGGRTKRRVMQRW
jgi:hypothetical protein